MLSKTHTKYIQSLQHKKVRDELGVFIAEGPKTVMDILATRKFVCSAIYGKQQWINENAGIVSLYPEIKIEAIEEFELEKISSLTTPNNVLAVFEQRQQQQIDPHGKITLALENIQDPGNLGTIIRIADWFGIENIICASGTADIYNSKVVQSTMGSLARVNLYYTNLVGWLQQNTAIKIYAATMAGKDLKEFDTIKEGIIVIGNEGKGISDEVLQLASEKISISKKGNAESLNAAVATGIILSHIS